jgi:hypothetical protein
MVQIVSFHLTRPRRFRTAFRELTDISRVHCVSAMAIELVNCIKCGSTLATVIFHILVFSQEVTSDQRVLQELPTFLNCTRIFGSDS